MVSESPMEYTTPYEGESTNTAGTKNCGESFVSKFLLGIWELISQFHYVLSGFPPPPPELWVLMVLKPKAMVIGFLL